MRPTTQPPTSSPCAKPFLDAINDISTKKLPGIIPIPKARTALSTLMAQSPKTILATPPTRMDNARPPIRPPTENGLRDVGAGIIGAGGSPPADIGSVSVIDFLLPRRGGAQGALIRSRRGRRDCTCRTVLACRHDD